MRPESVYKVLVKAGYPESFAEHAAQYASFFRGDVRKFVDLVEALAEMADAPSNVLFDDRYHIDRLTFGGYTRSTFGR